MDQVEFMALTSNNPGKEALSMHQSLRVAVLVLTMLFVVSSAVASPEFRSERLVTVQAGETLSEIVEREMRSGLLWPAIARHNNIQNPTSLRAGQVIRIPLIYTRSKENAVVLFVKGDVLVRTPKSTERQPLKRGEKVSVGDEIFTGDNGFASVEFNSGSVVNIQPGSHVAIVDIDCENEEDQCIIEIYAEKGAVQSHVTPDSEKKVKFLINTPSGSAAVRGTVFDINANNERSITGVTSGLVDFSAEGATENLNTGFGVIAKAGQTPGTPIPLLLEPVFLDIPVRLSSEDTVSWWKNDSATAYQVQVSQDEKASKVSRQITTTQSLFVPQVEKAGEYFLTVRPIDSAGLLGIPATAPVQLVKIKDVPKIPAIEAEMLQSTAAIFLNRIVKGVERYEIQVSYDESFREMLTSDVAADNSVYVDIEEGDTLYARVRSIYPNFKVSAFGDVIKVSHP